LVEVADRLQILYTCDGSGENTPEEHLHPLGNKKDEVDAFDMLRCLFMRVN
jgi:hypothetical protein